MGGTLRVRRPCVTLTVDVHALLSSGRSKESFGEKMYPSLPPASSSRRLAYESRTPLSEVGNAAQKGP